MWNDTETLPFDSISSFTHARVRLRVVSVPGTFVVTHLSRVALSGGLSNTPQKFLNIELGYKLIGLYEQLVPILGNALLIATVWVSYQ
jgi:hypothetical protein